MQRFKRLLAEFLISHSLIKLQIADDLLQNLDRLAADKLNRGGKRCLEVALVKRPRLQLHLPAQVKNPHQGAHHEDAHHPLIVNYFSKVHLYEHRHYLLPLNSLKQKKKKERHRLKRIMKQMKEDEN
jgi:hypothetical protein